LLAVPVGGLKCMTRKKGLAPLPCKLGEDNIKKFAKEFAIFEFLQFF
jgi:hypothetical protein